MYLSFYYPDHVHSSWSPTPSLLMLPARCADVLHYVAGSSDRQRELINYMDSTESGEDLQVIIYQAPISVLFPALNNYRAIKESARCDKRLNSFLNRPTRPKAPQGKVTK